MRNDPYFFVLIMPQFIIPLQSNDHTCLIYAIFTVLIILIISIRKLFSCLLLSNDTILGFAGFF